jgi:hypothetical protein
MGGILLTQTVILDMTPPTLRRGDPSFPALPFFGLAQHCAIVYHCHWLMPSLSSIMSFSSPQEFRLPPTSEVNRRTPNLSHLGHLGHLTPRPADLNWTIDAGDLSG